MNESQPPAPPTPAEQPAMTFPLQEGEHVLQVCRRHWLYLWPNILFMLVGALVPPSLAGFGLAAIDRYQGTVAQVFWVAAAVWIVVGLVRAFLAWYRYHNDMWVITSQRLIDSYRRHPLSLKLSTADLVNVQDMTVSRDGLMRTIFDFGDVVCETAAAGAKQDFHMNGIPKPRETQALIDRERDRERLRTTSR